MFKWPKLWWTSVWHHVLRVFRQMSAQMPLDELLMRASVKILYISVVAFFGCITFGGALSLYSVSSMSRTKVLPQYYIDLQPFWPYNALVKAAKVMAKLWWKQNKFYFGWDDICWCMSAGNTHTFHKLPNQGLLRNAMSVWTLTIVDYVTNSPSNRPSQTSFCRPGILLIYLIEIWYMCVCVCVLSICKLGQFPSRNGIHLSNQMVAKHG